MGNKLKIAKRLYNIKICSRIHLLIFGTGKGGSSGLFIITEEKMKKLMAVIASVIGFLLIGWGVNLKMNNSVAISIIGGADGPTSVFIAGKIGDGMIGGIILGGVLFTGLAIIIIRNNKKKKR